jgi:hypothetical protein
MISGNLSFKETINDVFGNDNSVAAVEFPCNLKHLSNKISLSYICTSDYLINKTTLFPYYAPFLPEKRKTDLISNLKNGDGKAIKYKLGFIAGSICQKNDLFYCPVCAKEEFEMYGEAFFHRFTQIQGSIICNKHGCYLVSYGTKGNRSRLEFATLKKDKIVDQACYIQDKSLEQCLLDIGQDIEFILNSNCNNMNEMIIHAKYLGTLRERGYLTASGTIAQIELNNDFKLFYGDTLLNTLESNIECNNEYNWLKKLTRKPRGVIHPIRHILFMRFLKGSVERFLEKDIHQNSKPFGEGPWPCLNICCEDYKKLVIESCKVTADYKSREPVGTFECKCGFIYSRKAKDDEYKIGRVKDFGMVWKNELSKLYDSEDKPSIRKIARLLNCDSNTVNRYLGILYSTSNNANAVMVENRLSDKKNNSTLFLTQYRSDVEKLMLDNIGITRSEIHKKLTKQYIWLYRNDRDWFDKHLPEKKTAVNENNRVCWSSRDIELLNQIKEEYSRIFNLNIPVRLTKGMIARRINRLELIEKWLHKLPQTRIFLDEITETIEQFQIRRVDLVCKSMYENGETLAKWKIVRRAGLKDTISERVNERIDNNRIKYNEYMIN